MQLFEKVKQARIQAMKNKAAIKRSILTVLVGELTTEEKRGVTITDSVVIQKINKLIKSNQETLQLTQSQIINGSLEMEINILKEFLPVQLTDSEINNIITASGLKTVPEIMKHFKENYSGHYDNKQLSQIAKSLN